MHQFNRTTGYGPLQGSTGLVGTPYRRGTVGRIPNLGGLTVGRAAQALMNRQPQRSTDFRALAEPWVEFQAMAINDSFFDDFQLRPRYIDRSLARPSPEDVIKTLADLAKVYKDSTMLFRWIACAVLTAYDVLEVRPLESYRVPRLGSQLCGRLPALQAITSCLANFFRCNPGISPGETRSPLHVIVQGIYGNDREVYADEMALLFLMFAEALGIHSAFVMDRTNGQLTVECQLQAPEISRRQGKQHQVAEFNPEAMRLRKTLPVVNRNVVRSIPGVMTTTKDSYAVRRAHGQYPPTLKPLMGKYRPEKSKFWRRPSSPPRWFDEVDRAIRDFTVALHKPYLVTPRDFMGSTAVAENHGPETTVGVIAMMSRIYAEHYGHIFYRIIADELEKVNGGNRSINDLSQYELAMFIANFVRDNWPYAEETVNVEEMTTPLRLVWMLPFFGDNGKVFIDCDDHSALYMTFCESCGIATAVRLAGDPATNENPTPPRYHVYPLVVIGREVICMDVASQEQWGTEMTHAGNEIVAVPRIEESIYPCFDPRQAAVAGSRLPSRHYLTALMQ